MAYPIFASSFLSVECHKHCRPADMLLDVIVSTSSCRNILVVSSTPHNESMTACSKQSPSPVVFMATRQSAQRTYSPSERASTEKSSILCINEMKLYYTNQAEGQFPCRKFGDHDPPASRLRRTEIALPGWRTCWPLLLDQGILYSHRNWVRRQVPVRSFRWFYALKQLQLPFVFLSWLRRGWS